MNELQEMKCQLPWLLGYRVCVTVRVAEAVYGAIGGTLLRGAKGWFTARVDNSTWLYFSANQVTFVDFKEHHIEIDLSLEE